MSKITDLFSEPIITEKIRNKLPCLFNMAEIEASRGGKVGMEIGSVRERIITALLRYYFGRENVSDDIPITEPETDVILFDNPLSIKTKTGAGLSGIKTVWTADWEDSAKPCKPGCKGTLAPAAADYEELFPGQPCVSLARLKILMLVENGRLIF